MPLRAVGEVLHRQGLELRFREVDGFLDRHDEVVAAEVLGELCGEAFRRFGVEDARHVDEQQVFGAEDLGVERGGDGGVDASRDADDDFFHVDAREEFADAIGERAVNVGNRRLWRLRRGAHGVDAVEVRDGEHFFVGRADFDDAARGAVDGARAVERVNRLAVVLEADVVDVEERRVRGFRLRAEDAVALVVLAERVRRGRDVDEEIDVVVAVQDVERRQAVVVAPAVLAEQPADAVALAADVEHQRGEQAFGRRAELARELLQAEEMARVVKFAVVRQQRLDDERVDHRLGRDELAVLRAEKSVVLAHAAVVVLFLPVNRDVAEENDDALRGGDDVLAIAFAVAQERRLLPGIAQKRPRDAHFREHDDIDVLRFRVRNHPQHRLRVDIRMSWRDFHLRHSDFQHMQTPLFVV